MEADIHIEKYFFSSSLFFFFFSFAIVHFTGLVLPGHIEELTELGRVKQILLKPGGTRNQGEGCVPCDW